MYRLARTAIHPTVLDTKLPPKGAAAVEYLSIELKREATNITTPRATFS
jgi:hypothetical protein